MRDFAWTHKLWFVVKDDGTYAGVPCLSFEEAVELSAQHPHSRVFESGRAMRTEKIYCPANGWDCPYFKNGECGLEDPLFDCDDFGYFWTEDDDYYCEDERRTNYD